MKVAVVGGTGFVGRHIANLLKQRQIPVVVISRSKQQSGVISGINHVQWDVADPLGSDKLSDKDRDQLRDVTSVVHCVGSLFDNASYKHVLGKQQMSSPFDSQSPGRSTILQSGVRFGQTRQSSQTGAYHKLNRESVKNVLRAFHSDIKARQIETVAFVSASRNLLPFPFRDCLLSSGEDSYLQSKLDAEKYLIDGRIAGDDVDDDSSKMNYTRLIFRPGFIYAEEQTYTMPVAATFSVMNWVKKDLLPTSVQSILPAAVEKPVHVLKLATQVVDAITNNKADHLAPGSVSIFEGDYNRVVN
ncbi:hypothetical protein MP228_010222 [Amoeboaphelidium protococcarum]|nr:hypothetical protein MP228_010222 [Amoeboaphelidium protococcarum]